MPIKLKIIIVVIIAILLGIWFFVPRSSTPKTQQLPLSIQQSSYRSLIPGKTLKSIVDDFLGKPIKATIIDGSLIQEYPSLDKERSVSVYLNKDEVVSLIIEPVLPSAPFSEVYENFQKPDLVLYGPYSPLGFNLFVSLTRGMAVLANPDSQIIYERWYFPITNKDYFLSAYSTGYSLIPPPTEQE
ncbi:MAG: hypothetical protein AAB492_05680 [Patescibacteria group bacterium]